MDSWFLDCLKTYTCVYRVLEYPHNNVNLANVILHAIDTYHLNGKIMAITFDNASSVLDYLLFLIALIWLKSKLHDVLLDGATLHVHCVSFWICVNNWVDLIW